MNISLPDVHSIGGDTNMKRFRALWYNKAAKFREYIYIRANTLVEAMNAFLLYMKICGGDEYDYKDIQMIYEDPDNNCITFNDQLRRYQDIYNIYPEFLTWDENIITNRRLS